MHLCLFIILPVHSKTFPWNSAWAYLQTMRSWPRVTIILQRMHLRGPPGQTHAITRSGGARWANFILPLWPHSAMTEIFPCACPWLLANEMQGCQVCSSSLPLYGSRSHVIEVFCHLSLYPYNCQVSWKGCQFTVPSIPSLWLTTELLILSSCPVSSSLKVASLKSLPPQFVARHCMNSHLSPCRSRVIG